jgi:hypothetical protein
MQRLLRIVKATFELSTDAAAKLRKIKDALVDDLIPVTKNMIVERLIMEADERRLLKHFETTIDRRIGEEAAELREIRRNRRAKKTRRRR